jgi:hypothetical protein
MLRGDGTVTGLSLEADRQTGSGRWESIHQLVLRDSQEHYWAARYTRGLTEYQDQEPFEGQEEVEFARVQKVPAAGFDYTPEPDGKDCRVNQLMTLSAAKLAAEISRVQGLLESGTPSPDYQAFLVHDLADLTHLLITGR